MLHDDTFEGRVGWKAIVAAPGEGTAVRSDAPSGDPTNGLRRYPEDLLNSPLDRRDASFRVKPGDGTLSGSAYGEWRVRDNRAEETDGFAGLLESAAAGEGVLLLLLLAAFGWGGLHALSPGHGKAMVAAYLVGTHGRPRHAIALGATVTVTHTIGVFALGLVTLALSQYVLPEDLYPWLNLASGLLVVVIGAAVLRSRIRAGRRDHQHHHHHHHHSVTKRGLLGMGAAAGLIPCPSALVVLLAAVSQHEIALGHAPHRRLQPRPRGHPHRARAGSRLRPQARTAPAAAGARGGPPRGLGPADRRRRLRPDRERRARGVLVIDLQLQHHRSSVLNAQQAS